MPVFDKALLVVSTISVAFSAAYWILKFWTRRQYVSWMKSKSKSQRCKHIVAKFEEVSLLDSFMSSIPPSKSLSRLEATSSSSTTSIVLLSTSTKAGAPSSEFGASTNEERRMIESSGGLKRKGLWGMNISQFSLVDSSWSHAWWIRTAVNPCAIITQCQVIEFTFWKSPPGIREMRIRDMMVG